MSEDRPKFPELSDLDWDAAIDEWERSTFVPAVARDADTRKFASPLGPSVPDTSEVPISVGSEGPLTPAPTVESHAPVSRGEGDDGITSLIRSEAPRSRGGLGQLFRRPGTSTRSVDVVVPEDDDDPATVLRRGAPVLPGIPAAKSTGRILLPDEREFDHEGETVVARTRSSPVLPDEPDSTLTLPRLEGAVLDETLVARSPGARASTTSPARVYDDAAPTPAEGLVALGPNDSALAASYELLRAEADNVAEPEARARLEAALAEIATIFGRGDLAGEHAGRAAQLGGTKGLGYTLARAFAGEGGAADEARLASLTAQVNDSTPEGRGHAALFAAQMATRLGNRDLRASYLRQAVAADPGDPRGHIERIVESLLAGDSPEPTEIGELAPLDAAAEAVAALGGGVIRSASADTSTLDTTFATIERARRACLDGRYDDACGALASLEGSQALGASALLAASAFAGDASERERLYTRLLDRGVDAAAHGLAIVALRSERQSSLERALSWPSLTQEDRCIVSELAGLSSNPELLAVSELGTAMWMRESGRAKGDHMFDADMAQRLVGSPSSRNLVALALTVAVQATPSVIREHARNAGSAGDAAVIEVCLRLGRYETLGEKLAQGAMGFEPQAMLAAALVCELASLPHVAKTLYDQVSEQVAYPEPLSRVLGALDPPSLERRLTQSAAALDAGFARALLRTEVASRVQPTDPAAALELFEAAVADDTSLTMASFAGERLARAAGDEPRALAFLRTMQASASDPVERTLLRVREGLLVADGDRSGAAALIADAHKSAPRDATLRDLYERFCDTNAAERAAWRTEQAAALAAMAQQAAGAGAAANAARGHRLILESTYDLESAGDTRAAREIAQALAARRESDALVDALLERLDAETGHAETSRDRLLRAMEATADPLERRSTLERIAALDAHVRGDTRGALAWHRALLAQYGPSHESLRFVEHALISDGVLGELAATMLAVAEYLPVGSPERAAHAHLAAAALTRTEGGFAAARAAVGLGIAADGSGPLWALRGQANHARFTRDARTTLEAIPRLLDAATSRSDRAALLVRAGEAAARAADVPTAVRYFSEAASEDSADVVAWGFLAEAKRRQDDAVGAALACESLGDASQVPAHRVLAWYEAGTLWQSEAAHAADSQARAVRAFEKVVGEDIGFQDAAAKLAALYTELRMGRELASLMDRRLDAARDPQERMRVSVERARALALAGDPARAKEQLLVALEAAPDHPLALSTLAELSVATGAYEDAERALLALARTTPDPREQGETYMRLGVLYARHLNKLGRAEVAFREVLKRSPNDEAVMSELVSVYTEMSDGERAAEVQRALVGTAVDEALRVERMVELANIHETAGADPRKAEQVYESARREFPSSVRLVEALVGFYERHKQTPAKNIVLDRAASDVRRAVANGTYAREDFAVLAAVYRLRGKPGEAAGVDVTWAAVSASLESELGPPCDLRGLDARIDDGIVPERLVPALRALLGKAGDAIDAALPVDLAALGGVDAAPQITRELSTLAAQCGLPKLRVLSTPTLARICLPVTSEPPAVLVGEQLLGENGSRARLFLWLRAIKALRAHAGALTRTGPHEISGVTWAWLIALDPTLEAEGPRESLAATRAAIHAALPIARAPDLPLLAREGRGALGEHVGDFGALVTTWVERSALVASGDLAGALDAMAWGAGLSGAPRAREERMEWLARTPKARELVAFAISDAYFDARKRIESL